MTIPEGIKDPVPVYEGRTMEAGKSYLCAGRFAGQMLLTKWHVEIDDKMYPLRTLLKVKPWKLSKFDPTLDWNDKDIWFYRGGGYGDLLMMTPLIREFKSRWPTCRLHVACGTSYFDLFKGMDVIPEMLPVPSDQVAFCPMIAFEEMIEGDPEALETHIAHMFARRANVPITDIKPSYQVTDSEKNFAEREYPKTDRKRIGIQYLASALYRSYPKMQALMMELSTKGEVFLFGHPDQIKLKDPIPGVTNIMERGFDFRESAAIINTCDICVSPDSAMVHLCSALDIPCVGLFGPFPSALRISSPCAKGIDGAAPCAPCFFHAETVTEFPATMPCEKIGRCVALENISINHILEVVDSLTPQGTTGASKPPP